jgi:hypothetical protein
MKPRDLGSEAKGSNMSAEQPTDRVSMLLTIAKNVCKSAEAQYDDYHRSFVGLDGKAQAAGTVAGLRLALRSGS